MHVEQLPSFVLLGCSKRWRFIRTLKGTFSVNNSYGLSRCLKASVWGTLRWERVVILTIHPISTTERRTRYTADCLVSDLGHSRTVHAHYCPTMQLWWYSRSPVRLRTVQYVLGGSRSGRDDATWWWSIGICCSLLIKISHNIKSCKESRAGVKGTTLSLRTLAHDRGLANDQ